MTIPEIAILGEITEHDKEQIFLRIKNMEKIEGLNSYMQPCQIDMDKMLDTNLYFFNGPGNKLMVKANHTVYEVTEANI